MGAPVVDQRKHQAAYQRQAIEANLGRYLEIEGLLGLFFAAFDFCLPKCIRKAFRDNGNQPVAACCRDKYYKLYDLEHPVYECLKAEREKIFGRPEDQHWRNPVSPCEYHNPASGCVLSTHKSPICLAFLCREGIEALRSAYGIYAYDYLGVNYALEWILTGDFTDRQYFEFRQSILAMTARLQKERQ